MLFSFGCSLRSSVVSSDALPSRHRHPLERFQRLIGCKRVHLRGWLQHATHCQYWSTLAWPWIHGFHCGELLWSAGWWHVRSSASLVAALAHSAPAQHVLLGDLSTVTAMATAASLHAPSSTWIWRREQAPDLRPLPACRFWLRSRRQQHLS